MDCVDVERSDIEEARYLVWIGYSAFQAWKSYWLLAGLIPMAATHLLDFLRLHYLILPARTGCLRIDYSFLGKGWPIRGGLSRLFPTERDREQAGGGCCRSAEVFLKILSISVSDQSDQSKAGFTEV